jgi:ketosteroid isomerase-like protein
MKRILALVTVMLAMSSLAFGQEKSKKNGRDARVEQELRELVRKWDEATVTGDAATLDRLLADEFAFVGGPRKAEYLASVKAKTPDSYVASAVSDEVQVQVYGDTAILTGLDTVKGKSKGQDYVNKWLYMDVWIKRAGRWQCVKTYSSPSRAGR